jgi:hypothetical protein
LSKKAEADIAGARRVHAQFNAIGASPDDFPAATLDFLLRNADVIYGIADCAPEVSPADWETFAEKTAFRTVKDARWTVRLLTDQLEAWQKVVELHSPKGAFTIVAPVFKN